MTAKVNFQYPPYSVLMSVYHKEQPEWLKISIESILKQTVMPKEFILVKDGLLTNELDSVINSFLAAYPELFRIVALEKNIGLGLALKKGVEECSCEYIARMDSDDYSVPERMQKELEAMDEKKVDIVGCIVDEFWGDISNIISHRILPETHEKIIRFAKKRTPIAHPSMLFKRSQVVACGNYEESLLTEDFAICIRLLHAGYLAYNIQEPLVYMRVNQDFYVRRGGINYLVTILKFNIHQWRTGWFSFFDFVTRSALNIGSCLLPNCIRKILYIKFLRN